MISIRSHLRDLGVSEGTAVLVHSNLALAFNESTEGLAERVLDCLEDLVGESGNITLPAFTYSFPQREIFDPQSRAGPEAMGLLSVEAFKRGYIRTRDPIFSFLMKPDHFKGVRLGVDSHRSFGVGSTLRKIVALDFLILNLGIHPASTVFHEFELEAQVPYRLEKNFTGSMRVGESLDELDWTSYVRDLSTNETRIKLSNLEHIFAQMQTFRTLTFGRRRSSSYKAQDARKVVLDELRKNPRSLVI